MAERVSAARPEIAGLAIAEAARDALRRVVENPNSDSGPVGLERGGSGDAVKPRVGAPLDVVRCGSFHAGAARRWTIKNRNSLVGRRDISDCGIAGRRGGEGRIGNGYIGAARDVGAGYIDGRGRVRRWIVQ